MAEALEGIRVLDLTHWQQGPVAAAMLGDWGADALEPALDMNCPQLPAIVVCKLYCGLVTCLTAASACSDDTPTSGVPAIGKIQANSLAGPSYRIWITAVTVPSWLSTKMICSAAWFTGFAEEQNNPPHA